MADDIIKRRFNAKSYIRVCRSIAFRLQYSTTLLLSGFNMICIYFKTFYHHIILYSCGK